ncbi:helix-turn-helix transcriptional regulator [Leuconostoc gelidum subsp. gelidum]|uniref:Helix-turn-helix transcriptional regulator n=1 Tax=Leuconostoc gelidum subsp. gelidum TaxID=1607839 RepID=A0AB35FZ71_LEUGE|nr:helix-turn-helix transcriptional regulator [Leuconostoc gelidum]MBZ5965038.1 helix-turn-helix transcriptional regulator [Leuconostoc gelidum subsp. gelidum]MBZ5974397.1 helix-turn-helix transcriptional regulator [Leuconostoc gelidum subsp. gelidum]MBZ5977236.1 helix-turn-helix transcriptional regulator [Leuconostoc gelidum subsp. gelidum]MBZ5986264.1 helix-turn-helix transcriptional regulator [Leuconostoc gelidum subsp. gelidum]MBZ5998888.1 helix-turn-helix transcriptional regulator [Leucon
MELGKQIKNYRTTFNYSQEQLAEKTFVSRQTISNWETNKSYPDVQSLLLLSSVFGTSLDELVKGDLQVMKNELQNNKNNRRMTIYSWIMVISFLVTAVSMGPILLSDKVILLFIPFLLLVPACYFGSKVESLKKSADIKTYSEILAFSQGKPVDELRRYRNKSSDFFEKFAIVSLFIIVFVGICSVSLWVSRILMS